MQPLVPQNLQSRRSNRGRNRGRGNQQHSSHGRWAENNRRDQREN
jgi:hypothetical protein